MTAIKTINNTSIAKQRFADAVSSWIEQLMKEGFNREHSTAMILNCLRRKETHEDKEVRLMRSIKVLYHLVQSI